MFGKLKDLNEMRKQAAQMQSMLAQEKVEVENQGVTIVMNGKMEILDIKIQVDNQMSTDELAEAMKKGFNEALKKVQRLMATKMMGQF